MYRHVTATLSFVCKFRVYSRVRFSPLDHSSLMSTCAHLSPRFFEIAYTLNLTKYPHVLLTVGWSITATLFFRFFLSLLFSLSLSLFRSHLNISLHSGASRPTKNTLKERERARAIHFPYPATATHREEEWRTRNTAKHIHNT